MRSLIFLVFFLSSAYFMLTCISSYICQRPYNELPINFISAKIYMNSSESLARLASAIYYTNSLKHIVIIFSSFIKLKWYFSFDNNDTYAHPLHF